MAEKEAKARIKINKLLEESGWRFFDDDSGPANIALEPKVKLVKKQMDTLGENFETASRGFIDFLLLDSNGFPLVVLEAKSEDKHPLVGKEQAREYAVSQKCRFVILSNGNLHYFWDLQQGNPEVITKFPSQDSVHHRHQFQPDANRLLEESISDDYIALTQMPDYAQHAGWQNKGEREEFTNKNRLRFLRKYQIEALRSIQRAVRDGSSRFLFEMATGTGKTLTSAALIKLFLRTGNAKRVLFLVDRLELEDQANKAFVTYLKNDYTSVIYKESRDEWRKAEIVVTTVQSLLFNDKYKRKFSPTDFDLVISDEAHRSIGGNARAVFEYFVGYKLGLTATPRDYLKRFDSKNAQDPREVERRQLLDTYRTFGCDSGQPTYRYSLIDGVREGFLINPLVVDARTDITTQLLSDEGYAVVTPAGDESEDESFGERDFEKKFFSDATNRLFCETFLKNALRDPINGEIGKALVFAVSQNHAAKLTQLLNEIADNLFPGRYKSDFAVQVTSCVTNAQQFTINFTNNNLLGHSTVSDHYRTSRARICVTVGMMTTGYDCPDILNLALMRPVFSPTDFVQIKGRGTRGHDFSELLLDLQLKQQLGPRRKERFKFFDFFASCEYFEETFDYDEVLKLPRIKGSGQGEDGSVPPPPPPMAVHEYMGADYIATMGENLIGVDGMKIDRMFFQKFEEQAKTDSKLQSFVEAENWDQAANHLKQEVFDKPQEFFNLEKLRNAAGVDRRISVRELLEKVFGRISHFKSKDEVLEDEFSKFVLVNKPTEAESIVSMKYYFKTYATDKALREIVDSNRLTELNVNPSFHTSDFRAVPAPWRQAIPEYIRNYVPLNQFL